MFTRSRARSGSYFVSRKMKERRHGGAIGSDFRGATRKELNSLRELLLRVRSLLFYDVVLDKEEVNYCCLSEKVGAV
jgi:hypothetical protein